MKKHIMYNIKYSLLGIEIFITRITLVRQLIFIRNPGGLSPVALFFRTYISLEYLFTC